MSRDVKKSTLLDRRTLMRTGAAAAFAAPIGVFGAQAFPQDGFQRSATYGRATEAEIVLERRRGLSRAAAGRDRSRNLPEAQSRCRTGQLQRFDRQVAGGDCDRQVGRRARHGAALAEAAGAGI